jgi:hypothetical protein
MGICDLYNTLSYKYDNIKIVKNELYMDDILISIFINEKVYIFNWFERKHNNLLVILLNYCYNENIEYEVCYHR